MIERSDPSTSPRPTLEPTTARRVGRRPLGRAVALSALALIGCGNPDDPAGSGGGKTTGGAGATGASAGTGGAGPGGAGSGGAGSGGVDAGSGGVPATGGLGGAPAGAAGMSAGLGGGGGLGGLGGLGGMGAGGLAGQAGSAMAGAPNLPPATLSETGLFTTRGTAPGELVLATGVREFEPKYWLWSDGADKKRYVYLPPGAQIDTTDADHWVFPLGTKFWKSFIVNGQLVETRLLERIGDGPNQFRYATYYWKTADATDATREDYVEQRINAAGTTHDIPNGKACERCHDGLKDHALGFSALQLNHDRPGVTLTTLVDEDALTAPIPLTIKVPDDDQVTQDALGYLHANCGNCHNDSPGLPVENVPEPQMLFRLSVNDEVLADTDTFLTAINQHTTASADLGIDYRIVGGSPDMSAVIVRMGLRMNEEQMPPIASELPDTDGGLATMRAFIQSLPPPPP
jgi:hypothetical protein